jgi:hypothetical protein
MHGETHLATLLRTMQPHLDERHFVFCSIAPVTYEQIETTPLCIFREKEGVTLILERQQADNVRLPYTHLWSLITLTVHSDLTAVGFLAAITHKLASAGISVNAVSAYYHDYLFIPVDDRDRAMALLKELSIADS